MPTCKLCHTPFTNRTIIDGVRRNLQHRKYCLTCSPFGQTLRKELRLKSDPCPCICSVCGREYTYDKSKGHTKTKCGTCSVNERRFGIKEKAVAYKGGKCLACGYNRCMRALKFHHLDPATKEFGIGGNHARKWEVVKKELDKCVLLCSNCHDEAHENLIKFTEDGNIIK